MQAELKIVEDSTESLGSYYKGKHTGGFGLMGCFSFNGNKIITTGGGGVIVTDDEELAKKAKHLTTQAKSDPFEYVHDEIGYNFRLVNVLAAMGVAQMELLPSFVRRKKEIDALYKKERQQNPARRGGPCEPRTSCLWQDRRLLLFPVLLPSGSKDLHPILHNLLCLHQYVRRSRNGYLHLCFAVRHDDPLLFACCFQHQACL